MQQDILPTTKKIAENAECISINTPAIQRFCTSFPVNGTTATELESTSEMNLTQQINLICVFNCINFCFWTPKEQKKWATEINGETIDGSVGLFRALEETLKNGTPLADAHFLKELTIEQYKKILNGNTEIPLLNERVQCLNEAGAVLLKNFNGSFTKILEAADGNAVKLTDLFITHFPAFNDYTVLNGEKVEFHKRAQLNTDMLNHQLTKHGKKELTDLDKLTAFADYKVPQMLRKFGIITYTPKLTEKIDTYTEISKGSREEIEIRATTIQAIEQIKEHLKPRLPDITAGQIDNYLWNKGQEKSPDDKPYHRTETICY